MSELTFTFPVPPTLNNMYFNAGRKRAKTPRYVAWRSLAVGTILMQARGGSRLGGHIDVWIDLPSNIAGDIDNRVKPILDALVTSGRIDDDRNVQNIHVGKTWLPNGECLVRVSATPATVSGTVIEIEAALMERGE